MIATRILSALDDAQDTARRSRGFKPVARRSLGQWTATEASEWLETPGPNRPGLLCRLPAGRIAGDAQTIPKRGRPRCGGDDPRLSALPQAAGLVHLRQHCADRK